MIPVTLTIHPDSATLRQAFIRKFTMPWEEFQVTHRDWIDGLAAQNHTVTYGELYLWDLMDHRAISFATALDFLRSMSGDVCITSERESNGGHHEFEIDGAEYTEVVIRGNAAELADLVWENLNADNKVSLFVRVVPLDGSAPEEIIINKNK